jgi:vacuolar-type H+-ATPase subunit F/Vma7
MIGYVIGDSDMITGFRLVGIEGIEISAADEAQKALNVALTRSDVGVIIISEDLFKDPALQQAVDKIRQEQVTPLIVEIPGSKGSTNKTALSDMVSKILGVKI